MRERYRSQLIKNQFTICGCFLKFEKNFVDKWELHYFFHSGIIEKEIMGRPPGPIGGIGVKIFSLLLWVGQFGFSILFPTLFFLILGVWLQNRFQLGIWIVLLCGVLGLLTSICTTRSCLHSLRKAADEASNHKQRPIAFNDHK